MTKTGHELDVWECAMIHLRASAPCSFGSLQHWLAEQVEGVTDQNSHQVTNTFLGDALNRRVVKTEKDGGIIYIFMC